MTTFDMSSLRESIEGMVVNVREAVDEKTLRAAGYAGAEVLCEQAKRNARDHVQTGTLYKNIIVKRLEEDATDTSQAYLVTVRTGKFGADGDAYYWRWVEKGHLFVRKRKGKRDTIRRRRADAKFAELVEFGSSSVPAYPFMRPAFESHKETALEAMKTKLAEKIKETLGK